MKVTVELSHDSVAALADALAARLKDAPKLAVETSVPAGFVSRTEAARIGVERKVLIRAERSGRLQAFKPGRVVVYRRRDVEALVEAHAVSGFLKGSDTEPEVFRRFLRESLANRSAAQAGALMVKRLPRLRALTLSALVRMRRRHRRFDLLRGVTPCTFGPSGTNRRARAKRDERRTIRHPGSSIWFQQ